MKSILDFTGNNFDRLLSWAKYLYWSELHRQQVDKWMEANSECKYGPKFEPLISAWFASLWVVIEGWRRVPLSDPFIDQLLASCPRYQYLLKQYRNSVYHYQPKLVEKRRANFLSEEEVCLHWALLLQEEFCRFYFELLTTPPVHAAILSEIRENVISMVGWVPDEIPEARIDSFRQKVKATIEMLQESGDFFSKEAQDLLEAMRQGHNAAAKAEIQIRNFKNSQLEDLKKRGGWL